MAISSNENRFNYWFARVVVVVFFLFALLFGSFVACRAFYDPDTCWLLALGRWIVEHKQLPSCDPFSFTYSLAAFGKAPILYQWLTETLFYLIYLVSGLQGLLFSVMVVLVSSFLVLPLYLLHQCKVPVLLRLILILLACLAACFHFLARPEIFSYLFLILWFVLIYELDQQRKSQSVLMAASLLLMLIWCNLHAGFVIGLLVLTLYVVSSAADAKAQKQFIAGLKILACSLLATFCTPYGIRLWLYLPHLFFMPANQYITELKPVTLKDLYEFSYYPYFVLWLIAIAFAIYYLRMQFRSSQGRFALLLILVCGISGFFCRRLIPFAALALLSAMAFMFYQNYKFALQMVIEPRSFDNQMSVKRFIADNWEKHFDYFYAKSKIFFSLCVLMIALIGCWNFANMGYLSLPQASSAFTPPFAAIHYLTQAVHQGRILNDSQFGDMMIWQTKLPVFIDTRFDMYGANLMDDYHQMTNCQSNWIELLEKYHINFIFVSPKENIITELRRKNDHAGWSELFRDQAAVILKKNQN